jgi:hypothetical protein
LRQSLEVQFGHLLSADTDVENDCQQAEGQQRDELNAGYRKAAYTAIGQ